MNTKRSRLFPSGAAFVAWNVSCWLIQILCVPSSAAAHDQIPGEPQSQPIVIQGGTVHVIDGPAMQGASVLFEAGKIVQVASKLDLPSDAVVIDATDHHVYPGLIDSMSDLGLREISAVEETDDRSEFGNLNPNVRSWVAFNPDSELIPVARSSGLLTALIAPSGSWIRGQAAVVSLDGWTMEDMMVAPSGLCVNWNAMQSRDRDVKKRQEKREAKFKEFDELLSDARRYREARKQNPTTTPSDLRLESLLPIIDRQQPMIVDADTQSEIRSAVAYAQSQELDVIICGGYDAVKCAELLRRYDIPVIVGSTYRLPLRRDEPYDASYTLPNRLLEAGIRFSIAGEGGGYPGGASQARNLPYHAACAVAYGLPHEHALRSITLSAAEILGVEDRIGSITVGKDATLIIANGDILETESNVTHAFVQGRRVDLGNRQKTLYEKYKRKYAQ